MGCQTNKNRLAHQNGKQKKGILNKILTRTCENA